MNKSTSLSELDHFMSEDKVYVFINDAWRTVKPFSKVTISEGYDPCEYILVSYGSIMGIGYASRTDFKNLKLRRMHKLLSIPIKNIPFINTGDQIHIKSRRGIYTVVRVTDKYIVLTCNKWRYQEIPCIRVEMSDFHCLYK